MTATVLGKRTRSSTFTEVSPSLLRARKRVHILEDDSTGESGETNIYSPSEGNGDDCMLLDLPPSPSTHLFIPSKQERDERSPASLDEPSENIPRLPPHTPRHRDALSKRVQITPRHRIIVGGRPLTPNTPLTPPTPHVSNRTIYGEARRLFTRGSSPGSIVGREKERKEIVEFISTRISARTGGCLYVSGPPGTGKSALVTDVCKSLCGAKDVKYIYVNCMSVKNAGDLYALALTELDVLPSKREETMLKALFLDKKSKASYVAVLDEMDSLLSLDLATLYSIFEWAFAPNSKLTLIGIANALDLTDRFLPKLKARNLKPELLPFLPYTATEIALVLTSKCRSLLLPISASPPDFVPILHPTAVQLISKKVASQTGDLRKSFDIARQVIDLIETETAEKLSIEAQTTEIDSPIKSPLTENPNISSPKRSTPSQVKARRLVERTRSYDALTAPRATLAHVVRITSAFFNNSATARLSNLNLQQRAVLFSLVSLERRNKQLSTPPATPSKSVNRRVLTSLGGGVHASSAAPTIRAVGQVYSAFCRRENVLHPLSGSEIRDVVGGLETSSLIVGVDGRKGSLVSRGGSKKKMKMGGFGIGEGDERRISACVSVGDCEAVTGGVGGEILKAILRSDGV